MISLIFKIYNSFSLVKLEIFELSYLCAFLSQIGPSLDLNSSNKIVIPAGIIVSLSIYPLC